MLLPSRLAALATILLLSGCAAPPPRPNVVVIVIDTLRSDHLGCYGYSRPTSPNLDGLASNSYVFDDAIAQSSWTAPSIASLFTSVYPSAHGVTNFESKLSTRFETLSQVLKRRGYRTAGISANLAFISQDRGFGLGFDTFELIMRRGRPDEANEKIVGKVAGNAQAVTDRALAFLDQDGPDPFFLYVHYIDPHSPYNAPAPFRNRFLDGAHGGNDKHGAQWFGLGGFVLAGEADVPDLIALYDGEIAFTDSQVGRVIDRLRSDGLLERSIVVVTSDHGEELYDHGGFLHGRTLYREQVQVPLIVRMPGASAGGARIEETVQLVDVGPTILEVVGQPDDRRHEGRSLLPLVEAREDGAVVRGWKYLVAAVSGDRGREAHEAGYSEVEGKTKAEVMPRTHQRSIRTPRWSYMISEGGEESLYDNRADRDQHHNLAANEPEVVRDVGEQVRERSKASLQRGQGSQHDEPLSEEARERMRALGYVE